jgi:CTP synthase
MEIAEVPGHPFFFATQFHPEFKSRPTRPSPPFLGFIEAALKMKRGE